MIKQILITIIIITNISIAQNYGSLRFANYADDRESAFSFTFDDGLLTQSENARQILNQYGFKGTFYVLPPYLADENQDTIWRYGTWPDFQVMAAEGHEIGSHTMNHYDLTTLQWGNENEDSTLLYELYQSKIFIEKKIPTKKCISFNYPYTIHNSVVDSAVSLFYENGRTLGQLPNDSSLSVEEWYKLNAKIVEFDSIRNSVNDDTTELYTFLTWTQNLIADHKWGMIIIHDVVPFNQLQILLDDSVYEPITNEWLYWLCDFLSARSSSKEVWVATVGNVTRYIKERDDASYEIVSSSKELIEINVTDNLVDEIYNYPLSAYIQIPDDWEYVKTEQNGVIDTLTTIDIDIERFVLAKVIPDNGILIITPISATSVDTELGNVEEFELYQNYPNPFNPSTKISYTILTAPSSSPFAKERNKVGFVTLKVFDVLGNEVTTLVNEYKSSGSYEVNFDASNLSSGVYYYQIKVGSFFETKKMILIR